MVCVRAGAITPGRVVELDGGASGPSVPKYSCCLLEPWVSLGMNMDEHPFVGGAGTRDPSLSLHLAPLTTEQTADERHLPLALIKAVTGACSPL